MHAETYNYRSHFALKTPSQFELPHYTKN